MPETSSFDTIHKYVASWNNSFEINNDNSTCGLNARQEFSSYHMSNIWFINLKRQRCWSCNQFLQDVTILPDILRYLTNLSSSFMYGYVSITNHKMLSTEGSVHLLGLLYYICNLANKDDEIKLHFIVERKISYHRRFTVVVLGFILVSTFPGIWTLSVLRLLPEKILYSFNCFFFLLEDI